MAAYRIPDQNRGMISNTGLRQSALFGMKEDRPVSKSSTTTPESGLLPNPHRGEILLEEFLKPTAAGALFRTVKGLLSRPADGL
jgi:hypothetical protein